MGRKLVSHFFGVIVAVAVVAGLVFCLYLSSGAYASVVRQDRMDALSLDELIEIIEDPHAEEFVEAIIAVGNGDDRLKVRVAMLAKAASSENPLVVSAATVGLRKQGEAALPFVKTMLESKDEQGDALLGCAAIRALGTVADSLAPSLKKVIEDGDLNARNRALYSFQTLSPEVALTVLPEAIESLDDSNFNVQCSACRVIERIGPEAHPAVERLLKLAVEGNVSTKGWACIALGAIGPVEGHDIAKFLESRLNGFAFIEKERALIGLANMGRDGESAKDEVEEMMTDNSRRCMAQACATYALITGTSEKPIAVMKRLLKHESYRVDASKCLGEMGPLAIGAVDELTALLVHHDEATRETAAIAIGKIGPAASNSLSALRKLSGDDDALVREAAKEAIASINTKK